MSKIYYQNKLFTLKYMIFISIMDNSRASSQGSKRISSKRRAQSIVKKNFANGIKAKNIYTAVQEISESEFLNEIEGDMIRKNCRYKHLKQDLRKMRKKAKTMAKYMQIETLNQSPKTYKTLKKINKMNELHNSNETTQLLNLSRVSSGLGLHFNTSKINAKSQQIFKKSMHLNEDSIFSILGFETKNKMS